MNEVMSESSMLEETGLVIAVEDRFAVIETQQRSACGHCGVSDSCGTSVLAGLFKKRRHTVRLLNHLNLTVGDSAVIGINESVLLSTAVIAYMLPLVMMIALAVTINLLGFGDNISFIFSMLGLFLGMQISNRIMGNKDFQSREIVLLRHANESVVQFNND